MNRDVVTGAMICRRFRLPRENIGFVRFIVEAYDGLAQVSAEAGEEEMIWLIPISRAAEAQQLIDALTAKLTMRELQSTASSPS